jgi:phosphate starvation-inducible PhoH-like protein
MVVTGDPTQVDLPKNVTSGLADALRRLATVEGVHIVRLSAEDVMRHRVVQQILDGLCKEPAAVGRRTAASRNRFA